MSVPYVHPNYSDGIRPDTQKRINLIALSIDGRTITTKRRSWCEICGHEVPVGASAMWSPGAPAVHEACFEQAHLDYMRGKAEDDQ